MADPLSQLRQYHINGREIKEHNGYIIFGEHGWPKDVNTNYQMYSTEDNRSKKEYYTLECLLYLLQNKDVVHTHYVKQAGRDNKRPVMRPDRKPLLAYLTGELQTAPSVDKNAPIPALRVPVSEIYKKDTPSGSAADRHAGNSSQGSSSSQSRLDPNRAEGQSSASKKRLPHDDDLSKAKEEFAARLNEPSTKKLATSIPGPSVLKSSEANESSAAINKFGLEKLAAMKAKRMAAKRTQIIDAESEPITGQAEVSNRDDLLYAADAEKIKLIKSKEKVWRTRSSILQSHKKKFGDPIIAMLPILLKSEDPNRKPTSGMPAPPHDSMMMNMYPQQNNSHQQQQQQQQSIQKSYNRYDQERFVKLDIGVEIDTKRSLVGGVSNGLTQPTTRPAGPVPINGAALVPRPHGDVVDHRRPPASRGLKKPRSLVPIIIIPATTTSIINMYNAKTILEELSYVEGKAGNIGRENEILIQRKKADGTSAHYKVIDNPQKLELEDWQRVVAVFVQGPSWQFKGWPWGGSPVDIFSNMKGFHLKWDEAKLDDNVAKWNVQVLELSRNKRHLDKANLMRFWASLDAFMSKYRTYLKF